MHFTPFIQSLISLLNGCKYVAIFVGAVIEGPVLMITCGFLIHAGFLDLTPTFIALAFGDLLADVIWYHIGYYLAEPMLRKHGRILRFTPEMFEKSKKLFEKYHERILFFSKITVGLGISLVTLMTAGATKVALKKYILVNTLGELFFVSMTLSIGYFFGEAYALVSDKYKLTFAILGISIPVTFIYFLTKYIKRKIANI